MKETSIRELFSYQDRKYKIPSYQRSYSWETVQISQFIQDLKETQNDYYLGHFLFEGEDSPSAKKTGPQTWLVIDGQQRLTTCLIFFSVLRNELLKRRNAGETTNVDVDDLEHFYLRDSRKKTQRMETVAEDNNFFVSVVIEGASSARGTPSTRSQQRILGAVGLFKKDMEGAPLSALEQWHDLVANARCTHYCVPDKVSAAKIFAFQNDRGKELSQIEILKSYFMLQVLLHGGEPEVVAEHLKFVEQEVAIIYQQIVRIEAAEDDVLRYCWQASEHSLGFNTRKTVDEIKAYIVGAATTDICLRIRNFMAQLAEAFRTVERVEKHAAPEFTHLRYLNNMALAYPFLIKAGLAGATEQATVRLAKLLENVTFRYMLRGGRAGIETRLNGYLTLPAGNDYVTALVEGIVSDLHSNGWWDYWSDKVMLELLNAGYFYQNRVDNYVLWRYELDLCANSGYPTSLKITYADLLRNESIEHIAPRTETAGGAIAAGYGAYNDTEDPANGIESGEQINCLGNLMLISQSHNSSIGNKPFNDKLLSYGKDNLLSQQKEIVEFVDDPSNPVWSISAITKRHDKILKTAQRLWSLDAI